jgi:superfamily II DNA or RNA helicase
METWKLYEYFICEYHAKNYNHKVWHNNDIPEEELEQAGFINSYNKFRLDRIARKREAKGNLLLYSDYGMDFLAKEEFDNPLSYKYYTGQCKYYNSRKITASDIGTFLSVTLLRLKTKGYLYSNARLEVNLSEDIRNTDITYNRVDFDSGFTIENIDWNSDGIKEVQNSLTNQDFQNSTEETYIINELDIELRDYQKEAVISLNEEGRKLIQIFCGGGKTLILSNYLKQSSNKRIVAIAPLKISVHNLRARITPFINMETLLVDSDYYGTTDKEIVDEFIKKESFIIFTTIKSFEDIIMKCDNVFDCIILDEVHNIENNDELCDWLSIQDNIICVSATISEDITEKLDAEIVYNKNIAFGISEGYICDYQVWFPLLIEGKLEFEYTQIPIELEEYDKSLCAKAFYLTNCMLTTGSRKCIVFLSNHDECDIFKIILKNIFEEYFAIPIWTSNIDSRVSYSNRNNIIKTFADNDRKIFSILTSVRILDESVDIIQCDSTFITNISDNTSEIRTIQRMSRACRKDKNNINKINNLFLWCDSLDNSVACLSLLKTSDINFHKKIKTLNINYDKKSKKNKTNEIQYTEELNNFINIKCLNEEQIWEIKYNNWVYWYNKLGKFPSKNSKDKSEKQSGIWQLYMRVCYKKNKLSHNKVLILNNTNGWKWKEESFYDNLELYKEFYEKNNKNPNSRSTDKDEKKIAIWISHRRMDYKNKILSSDKIDILNKISYWKWREDDIFYEKLELYKDFYEKNNKNPNSKSTDKNEKKIIHWIRNQKRNYKNNLLSQDKIEILNKISYWKWGNDIKRNNDNQKEKNNKIFYENLELYKEFYEKNNTNPNRNSIDKDEKKIARWISGQRTSYKNKILSEDKIELLNKISHWKWKEEDPFYDNLELYKEFYEKNNRNPMRNSVYKDEKKIAQWISGQRTSYRRNLLSQDKIEILENLSYWKWSSK